LGAFGYAMGGKIAKEMGGWQVICWVNVLGLPITLIVSWMFRPESFIEIPLDAWIGFVYLALASQLFGFFLWYKGLVLGGIARVSQTQLLQPFLSIIAAIILLDEQVDLTTYLFALAVVVVIAVTRKMQIKEKQP
jgi:drug/metabolite transporter (DMT)-like permease